MSIYKNYLFNNLLKPFLLSFFIILGIVWLTRIINYVSYLTEYNISFSLFLNMIILVIPSILTLIIIISVIISIINTYNKLLSTNELIILKNTGLNNKKLIQPIIFFSLILSICCFCIQSYIAPIANKKLYIIKENIYNDILNIAFKENDFNKIKNFVFYTKERDKNILKSVIVSINDEEYKSTIYAKKAVINGNIIKFDNGNIQIKENNEENIIFFDEYIFNLNEFNKKEQDEDFSLEVLNIKELLELDTKNMNKKKYTLYLSQISSMISMSCLCFSIGIFAGTLILKKPFNRQSTIYTTIISFATLMIFILMTYIIKNGEKNIYSIYASHIINFIIIVSGFIINNNYLFIRNK